MKTRIHKIRTSCGLTQKQFAERLGMKQNTVAGWESGRARPSKSTIRNICTEFGISEAWLRTGSGKMFVGNYEIDNTELRAMFPNASPEVLALIKSIAEMPVENQRALAQFIKEGAESIQRAGGANAMRELADQLLTEEEQAVV